MSNHLNNSLLYAIHDGDKNKVTKLLLNPDKTQRPDINFINQDGYSPLIYAIVKQNLKIIELLLKQGADTELKAKNGYTAFHYAAESSAKNEEIFKILLKYNANIEARTNHGYTPLLLAVIQNTFYYANSIYTPKALINLGADKNAVNNEGKTALHLAIEVRSEPLVHYFIEQQADIEEKDKNGITPLLAAANKGWSEIIPFLIEKNADITATDIKGRSALHIATEKQDEKTALVLLEQNIDINAVDNEGETPLHYAATKQAKDVAFLLQHGANTEIKNNVGNTPICNSVTNLTENTFTFLADNGANLSVTNNSGKNLFEQAVSAQHIDAIKYLVQNGKISLLPENQLNKIKNKITSKNKKFSVEELLLLPQKNPNLLRKLIITNELKRICMFLTFDEQIKIYQSVKKILPSSKRQELEKAIRHARMVKEKA